MYRSVVIDKNPSMVVWLLFCVHWSWTLGLSDALHFDKSRISYGSVCSVFAVIPGLWSFGKILLKHRIDIKNFIKNSPSFFSQGMCFLLTGRKKWASIWEIEDRDYFHWGRRRWLASEYLSPNSVFVKANRVFPTSRRWQLCVHWTARRMDCVLCSGRHKTKQPQ